MPRVSDKLLLDHLESNGAVLLEGEVPHLIDEWQLAPSLWNAVRYEVDQRDDFGQFILTGSSVPAKLDESMHTGTGRIARMKMRPMSLYESGDSNGQVSLGAMFEGSDVEGLDDHNINDMPMLRMRQNREQWTN